MFATDGVVNRLLGAVGIETTFAWLGNTKTAIWVLILLAVWQFGSSMLIFLSALKQISKELYEAAEVDGANGIQKFFRITLPLLTPTIFFNLVMQMINGFLAFTQSLSLIHISTVLSVHPEAEECHCLTALHPEISSIEIPYYPFVIGKHKELADYVLDYKTCLLYTSTAYYKVN